MLLWDGRSEALSANVIGSEPSSPRHGPNGATTLVYLQDFRIKMWITLAAIPLILLLRGPSKAAHAPDKEMAAAID